MIEKVCQKCKKRKPVSAFYKSNFINDGYQRTCRSCDRTRRKTNRSTKQGWISKTYSSQKQTSIKRKSRPPNYTKEELLAWILAQPNFQELWDNWVRSNYDKKLTPSVDRKNDYLPYSLNNLNPITTWEKHQRKSADDIINCINNKTKKKVAMLDVNCNKIAEFISASEASRQTGINLGDISSVANKRTTKSKNGRSYQNNTAGGYKWEYI